MNKLDKLVEEIIETCLCWSIPYNEMKKCICNFVISCEIDSELRKQLDGFMGNRIQNEQE